jgi:hypothetical protein
MCDYSLLALQNRLAHENDHLVVHRFSTGTLGLVAEMPQPVQLETPTARSWWRRAVQWLKESNERPPCVVCVPPGARLRLRDIPTDLQREIQVGPVEDVTFTQIGADQHAHRDAIRFVNGRALLLQKLTPGQRVDVLSLTLVEDLETEPISSGRVPTRHVTVS